MAEILARADQDAQRAIEVARNEERQTADWRTKRLLFGQRQNIYEGQARKIAKFGRRLVVVLIVGILLLFTALYDTAALFTPHNYWLAGLQLMFLIPAVLGILDLVGVSLVKPMFERLERYFFEMAFRFLHGGADTPN
jgi:hypothetical protein